jgi:D-xylose transport system permease protein
VTKTEPSPPTSRPADAGSTQGQNFFTAQARDIATYGGNYVRRVRGGEMGSLPAVTGLIVLTLLFALIKPSFHTAFNFGSMLTEGTATIFIAMGLVFVLLLGEIDLSAGYSAGVSAAIMARLTAGYNVAWPISIGAALVSGVVIGFAIGWLRAKVRIPSFVITLAFFLAFQGLELYIVDNGPGAHGSIPLTDSVQNAFANSQMPIWAGWLMIAIIVAGYAGMKAQTMISRRRRNLPGEPIVVAVAKVLILAAVAVAFVLILNTNRALNKTPRPENVNGHIVFVSAKVEGVPWVVPVLLVLFVIWTFVLSRTRYGRHVYAVGGNEEASRRAGIAVDRVRISVFVLCSFMSAVGGIMIGSNIKSVDVQSYGGNVLLLAVGAAVIGGTSLFGGRGRMSDALIGGAVVEVIYNGLATLVNGNNSSAFQYMATGGALLLAAAADAISRRRAGSSGLA